MPYPAEIAALVQRVAEALGPDASPAEVERVARAVLGTRVPSSAEPPPRGPTVGQGPISGRIILTAYGCDRPGILAALSSELRDLGVNILDVSQKILQGYFTLILLADITGSGTTIGEVQQRLRAHGERLGVRVLVQHEELFEAMARP